MGGGNEPTLLAGLFGNDQDENASAICLPRLRACASRRAAAELWRGRLRGVGLHAVAKPRSIGSKSDRSGRCF